MTSRRSCPTTRSGAGQPDRTAAGQVGRRRADEHLDLPGLDDPVEVAAGEGGPVGVHAERARRRPRPGSSATRAKPVSCRTGRVTWRDDVVQVELDDLVAGPRAGVADPDRHA